MASTTLDESPLEFDPFSDGLLQRPVRPLPSAAGRGARPVQREVRLLGALPLRGRLRGPQGLADLLQRPTASTCRRSAPTPETRRDRCMIMMDPPEHDRLRALVSRVFTPQGGRGARAHDPRRHRRVPRPLSTRPTRSTPWPTSPPPSRSRSSRGCSGSPRASASRSGTGSTPASHREPGQMDPVAGGHAGRCIGDRAYFLEPDRREAQPPG